MSLAKLESLNHWTVIKGVDDPHWMVFNMHDILNEKNRAVGVEFQAMYDRLILVLRKGKRPFTWQNVRDVLGRDTYTAMASHSVGNTETARQITALMVYYQECENRGF
jgi:hypothetical protein